MRVIVKTQTELDDLIHALQHAPIVAVDTETNGLDLHGHTGTQAQLVGLSIAHGAYSAITPLPVKGKLSHVIKAERVVPRAACAYYVPIAHGHGTFTPNKKTAKGRQAAEQMQATYDLAIKPLHDLLNVPPEFVDALRANWPDTVIMHNAQFDLTALHYAGFPTPSTVFDTMVGAYVLFTHWRGARFRMPDTGQYEYGNMRLKWLGRLFGSTEQTGYGLTGDEAGLQDAVNDLQQELADLLTHPYALDYKKHLWALPPHAVGPYACMDVELVLQLHATFLDALEKWENVDLYERLSQTQLRVAWRMHMTGLRVDQDAASAMIEEGIERLNILRKEAAHESGLDGFNPASPKQIKGYLSTLGIHVESTGKEAIKELSKDVPLMATVAEYRDVNKLISTYVAKWHNAVSATEGILHPNLNVPFVKTGRWSSSSPYTGNLQNIPSNTAKTLAPKSLLGAVRPGWWLFELDYSGLEMTVGAWIAETLLKGDRNMTLTGLIESGADMHAYTRDTVGVPELLLRGDVNEANCCAWLVAHGAEKDKIKAPVAEFMQAARKKAKVANFLIMYGGGVPALTSTLGIDASTAQAILSGWRKAYPAVPKAQAYYERQATTSREAPGGSRPIFAYVRYPLREFPLTRKYNYYSSKVQGDEARNTFNSVSQGTAGGLTALSADRISTAYPSDEDINLHLTVHDSILPSLPPHKFEALKAIVSMMVDWPIRPQLAVDVEAVAPGGSWAAKRKVVDLDAFITSEGREGYEESETE
jgi:DNA polymerase I-like protein with 3'-5' exonuclease and polymerase domains